MAEQTEPTLHPRFTLTPLFNGFLETVSVDQNGAGTLLLVCTECEEDLCLIESNDTLGMLLRTALGHDTECRARETSTDEG